MFRILRCLLDQHEPRLVVLAAAICLLTSFTASALLVRARAAADARRLLWIVVVAVEFGCGVWALHFIAMLAFMPGMPIRYDLAVTVWSAIIAVAGSLLAFLLAISGRPHPLRAAAAAAMLTFAVGGMHYTGIAAMRLDGTFRLDPDFLAVSIGASALLCFAAVLSMARPGTLGGQLLTAVLLSAAISALHFVGMSAMEFRDGAGMPAMAPDMAGSGSLALVVATASLALVLLSLALSIMDRLLHDRACAERARLRKLTAVSFEGLLIERDGIIVDANERLEEFSGYALADLVGRPVHALLSWSNCSDPDGIVPGNRDSVLRRANGDAMPVELLAQPISFDRGAATAVAIRDLTARRDAEATLHRLAHHDPLTGLANRALLDSRMREAFEASPARDRCGALFCLDLDRFKPVNDLLGHAAGDKLLVAVSKRLAALLRPIDTLARAGGDEFVVLMPDAADMVTCRAMADAIVAAMREPFPLDEQQLVVGVSIGIALFPDDGRTAEELLRCADIALYRSKEEGRGTYRLFESKMDAELQHRRALERDLKLAIDERALELFYQPLVNCETGDLEGYEALLRWQHPRRGFIPPADFIPAAEESGLILPLGQWVLETACAAATTWDATSRVAVNLSPMQFKQADLVDRVMDILRRTGLSPSRLELEVTEGVLIDEPERAVLLLSALRAAGIRISLDDFGTGYSSLSYLRQFPLDKIKIDRSFVRDLGADHRSAAIVRAIVALAHSLDLSVTAEGVETEQQLDLLRTRNCNQVQGYLLGRPARLERSRSAPPVPMPAVVPSGRGEAPIPDAPRSLRDRAAVVAEVVT